MKRLSLLAATLAVFSCTLEEEVFSGIERFDYRVVVDGQEYRPVDETETGIMVFVPYGTDMSKVVAKFNDRDVTVTVGGTIQESGVTANDFQDYNKGVNYLIESTDSTSKTLNIKVLDTKLPVLAITTRISGSIMDRKTWREATLRVRAADGRIDKGSFTYIRGRGNWTWEKYPKKPYALKLGKKQELLGMPAHKRWALLALYQGCIGNALAFEATRRAPSLGWAPRGCFVELVLNGKFQGIYYLCEQIKIDKNRVNIASLKETDVNYPEVSGGYLLEYDELYDEDYKFRSSKFSLPVQLKAPNDNVPDAQFNYIKGFINDMEAEIKKIGTSQESHYADYMDIESFAEYWFVLETVNNYEAYKPRSVKMYKGRDGVDSPKGTVCKLKAGPLWDQEWFLVQKQFNSKDMYYYHYLFQDPAFVSMVKSRWPSYRDSILGKGDDPGFLEYLNDIVDLIRHSANRDTQLWDNPNFTLQSETERVMNGFVSKITWMDQQIQNL